MSDHEFEKQVQQRMDELKFRPSDAVWTAVEKNIRREKRRRRALIWLPLLFLLLATGGYVVFSGKQDGARVADNKAQVIKDNEQGSANQQPANKNEVVSPEQRDDVIKSTEQVKTNEKKQVTDNKEQVSKEKQQQIKNTEQRNVAPVDHKTPSQKTNINRQGNKILKDAIATKENSAVTKEKAVKEEVIDKDEPVHAETVPVQDKEVAVITEPLKDSTKADVVVQVDSTKVDALKKDSAAVPKEKNVAVVKVKQKKSSKWQWGVKGGAGVSNVAQGGLFNLLQKTQVADLSMASAPPSTQYNISVNPPPSNRRSSIEAGPAFSIGGFVKKSLSNRFSVSAGLQYSYFGLRTSVGNLVNNSRTVNFGLSNSQVVDRYYGGNNLRDYTNQYHFIELPVEIHWQLNKSKRTPIVFDAGVSLSRLISTNALHYDGSSGVYYKDNSLFNKTQFDLLTGLNIGLFQKRKYPIWIGPDLHYSMTRLVKKEFSDAQFLWSTGISIKMLLKK